MLPKSQRENQLYNAVVLRPYLEIFGDDYPTADGTCVRDYIHVVDLGAAHLQAVGYLQRAGESVAFNLGNGKGYLVKDVIGAVQEVTGRRVPVRVSARRVGDPPVLVARSTMARKILDWTPSRPLEQIVASAWRWMHSRRRTSILANGAELH